MSDRSRRRNSEEQQNKRTKFDKSLLDIVNVEEKYYSKASEFFKQYEQLLQSNDSHYVKLKVSGKMNRAKELIESVRKGV